MDVVYFGIYHSPYSLPGSLIPGIALIRTWYVCIYESKVAVNLCDSALNNPPPSSTLRRTSHSAHRLLPNEEALPLSAEAGPTNHPVSTAYRTSCPRSTRVWSTAYRTSCPRSTRVLGLAGIAPWDVRRTSGRRVHQDHLEASSWLDVFFQCWGQCRAIPFEPADVTRPTRPPARPPVYTDHTALTVTTLLRCDVFSFSYFLVAMRSADTAVYTRTRRF